MARFSLFVNPLTIGPEHDTEVIDATLADIALADEMGFEGVFLSEHHFSGYNCYGSPFQFGARVAADLQRAWLGFAVATPSLYHPARFAEEANLLDQLMKGRFLVGTGSGGIPAETAGFGYHHSEGRERQEAAMKVVLDLWNRQPDDPPYDFDNGYHRGRILERIVPSPYRSPHPLILRATTSESGMHEAAAKGWPMYLIQPGMAAQYAALLDEAGHSADTIETCLRWTLIPSVMYVADTDDQAMDEITGPFERMGDWIVGQEDRVDQLWPDRHEERRRFEPPEVGSVPHPGPPPFGSPDSVVTALTHLVQHMGVDHLMVGYNFGQMEPDKARRSLELFAREVMPRMVDVKPEPLAAHS
jgi:alkanesulfonate monooxygenase SsuD/methylene tetrahydromethanopterin reductase-like flavin-dependent oxidoreductase (luciferase family)